MGAYIKIFTNTEGEHKFDLDDVREHDSILEFLDWYLFDEDEGTLASLDDHDREQRRYLLSESRFGISGVEDDDFLADVFFKQTKDGINSFDLYEYKEVMDLIDLPSSSYDYGPIAAYIEWAGEWSKSDFDSTYEGEYPSDKAFVQSKQENGGEEIPDWIRPYFDWDQFVGDEMSNYHEQDGFYFSCM